MRRRVVLVLLVLTAVHLAADLGWHAQDDDVQLTDAAYHYSQIIELRDAIRGGPDGLEGLSALPDSIEHQRYGRVWYWVAAVIASVTAGDADTVVVALALILWPALLFAMYLLGAELAPPDRKELAGIVAAAVGGFLPAVSNYARVIVLDLPLAAAVAWAAWAMLRLLRIPEGTTAYRRTAWLAAAMTLVAVGIKVNALAFLVGPAWVAARPRLRRGWAEDRARVIRGLGVTALVAGALAAWLLLGSRGDALVETARDATWPGKALDYAAEGTLAAWPGDWLRGAWSHSWQVAYFTILQTFTPLLLLVTIAAYGWYFARRRGCEDERARAQRDAVFWWWAIPVGSVLVLLRGMYDERYILPLLPQAAALIGVSVAELPGRPAVRRAVAGGLVVFCLLSHEIISYDRFPTARPALCATVPGWATDARVGGEIWLCAAYPSYSFMDRPTHPVTVEWRLTELEAALQPVRDWLDRPLRAVFLDDVYDIFYASFQRDLLGRALFAHENMLLLSNCADAGWVEAMHGGPELLAEEIREADVVLMRGASCTIPWNEGALFDEGGWLELADGTALRWWVRAELSRPRPP